MGTRNITRIMVRDDRPETPCYKRFPETSLHVKTIKLRFLYVQHIHKVNGVVDLSSIPCSVYTEIVNKFQLK